MIPAPTLQKMKTMQSKLFRTTPVWTAADVWQQLNSLTDEIAAAIGERRPAAQTASTWGGMDNFACPVRLLLDLPAADLKCCGDALPLLRSLCRLLIQLGEQPALDCATQLSFRLHEIERGQNQSFRVSDLYRGICQIGQGQIRMGARKVLKVVQNMPEDEIFHPERCLSYWALISAAIHHRDLRLAARFAEQWRQTAAKGVLRPEAFRGRLVLQLISLLLGDANETPAAMKKPEAEYPDAWQGVVVFLQEWTQAAIRGEDKSAPPFPGSEPLPLLLGLDWNGAQPASRRSSFFDFTELCALRRRFSHPLALRDDLTAEQVLDYAGRLVAWELLKPLRQVEQFLKKKNPVAFYKFMMARILGKYAFEQITYETPVD